MKFSTRYVKVNTCQLEGKKLHSKGSKDDMICDYPHKQNSSSAHSGCGVEKGPHKAFL